MDQATEALVIINSVVLIIFLIVSLFVLTILIRILHRVDRISEKAEKAVENLEAAAITLRESATPIGFGRALGSIVNKLAQRTSDKVNNRRS